MWDYSHEIRSNRAINNHYYDTSSHVFQNYKLFFILYLVHRHFDSIMVKIIVRFLTSTAFWGAVFIRGRRLFWSECQWCGVNEEDPYLIPGAYLWKYRIVVLIFKKKSALFCSRLLKMNWKYFTAFLDVIQI